MKRELRVKTIRVSPEFLLDSMQHLSRQFREVEPVVKFDGIPESAEVKEVFYDNFTGSFYFVIYDESFPIKPEGERLEEIKVVITRQMYKKVEE